MPAEPASVPSRKLPDDARLQPLKDLDGYFPFTKTVELTGGTEVTLDAPLKSRPNWPRPSTRVASRLIIMKFFLKSA